MEISSSSSTHPLAEIDRIQFGLLTARQMDQISVYRRLESARQQRDLFDPRLGLPNHINKCSSCGSGELVGCEGHFGLVNLPSPIYNPCCIHQLVKLLDKICLNCYALKENKAKKEAKNAMKMKTEDRARTSQNKEHELKPGEKSTCSSAPEKGKYTGLSVLEDSNDMIKKEPIDGHIILSDDDIEIPINTQDGASSSLKVIPNCTPSRYQPRSCKAISTVKAFIDPIEEGHEDDSRTPITRKTEDSSVPIRAIEENMVGNSSHKEPIDGHIVLSNDNIEIQINAQNVPSSSLEIIPNCTPRRYRPRSYKAMSTVKPFIDLTKEGQEDDSRTPITREKEDSSVPIRETEENVLRNSSHKEPIYGHIMLSDDDIKIPINTQDVPSSSLEIIPTCAPRRYRPRSCKAISTMKQFIDLTDEGQEDDSRTPITRETEDSSVPIRETEENVFGNSSHKNKTSVNSERNDGYRFRNFDSEENTILNKESCSYCQGSLPKLILKVSQKRLIYDEIVEMVDLIVKGKSSEIPIDYWSFLGGEDSQSCEHTLLPSEALNILKNIPLNVVKKLGIDVSITHPRAFILQKILIPPNCTRIPEQPFILNQHLGADPMTQMLGRIVRKVEAYKNNRAMKISTNSIAIREAEELQSMISLYLRMKGAPKVKGNKEPAIDFRGRASDRNLKSHRQRRLHINIVGKITNFSCRGVLTGDPFLSVHEIGIPEEVARSITVPEFVTATNVEALQSLLEAKGTFVRISRNGEKKELDCEKTQKSLQVGDCLSRQLRDGDLAFCNRPPSLHKHSMISLKVRIFQRESFCINPILCSPLEADFDGDCIHLFFPQSYPSLVEMKELLMLQNQMIESRGGDPTVKLTQDILLAASLIMETHVFLSKDIAQQLGMWCALEFPQPTIIQSPKGPLWTGLQFLELLFCTDSSSSMLHREDLDLKSTLKKRGPDSAISFLKSSQELLTEWFSVTGFSSGIWDFQGAKNVAARIKLEFLKEKHFKRIKKYLLTQFHSLMLVASRYIMNVEDTKEGFIPIVPDDIYTSFDISMVLFPNIAQEIMQESLFKIEKDLMTHIDPNSALNEMLRSGSKGSTTQLIQHCSFLGLQYSRGNILSPSFRRSFVQKCPESLRADIFWVERGLVESSFIHGLNPREFYMHCSSTREGMIQHGLVLHEPGYLSKNLMHFLRDMCVSYDGTVRSKLNMDIIQFKYGGVKTEDCSSVTNFGELNEWEDSELRWDDTVHAGEPVGALSAMAVVKPAYEMILQALQKNKMRVPCPLKTLKEIIYTRKGSNLKIFDRMVILRFNRCEENDRFWQERTASLLQRKLQKISLKEFSSHVWISYNGRSSEEGCQTGHSRMKSDLIGHIKLSAEAMVRYGISSEIILTELKKNLLNNNKLPPDLYERLFFCTSDHCELPIKSSDISGTGFCIHVLWRSALSHFCPSILAPVLMMKNTIFPSLLETNILGKKQIQSATIIWEDSDFASSVGDGRISLTVIVEKTSVKKRGDAWNVVKNACQTLFHYVDWKNSGPFSIQEVQSSLGVEAARSSIIKRLKLVLTSADKKLHEEHVSLVADVMTHAGYVVGLNVAGFQEYASALSLSCPLKKGLFQNPVKCYLDASIKGASENLDSIVSAATFGKVASIGTGFEFECLWKQPQVSEDPILNLGMGAADIFDFLSFVGMTPTPESPLEIDAFSSVEAQHNLGKPETDNALIVVSDKFCQEDKDMNKSNTCSQSYDGWDIPNNDNFRKDEVMDMCDGWAEGSIENNKKFIPGTTTLGYKQVNENWDPNVEKLGGDMNEKSIYDENGNGKNQRNGWDLPTSHDGENVPNHGHSWGESFEKKGEILPSEKENFEKGGLGDIHIDNPVHVNEVLDSWGQSSNRTDLGNEKLGWGSSEKSMLDRTEKMRDTSGKFGQSEKRHATEFVATGANVIPMGTRKFNRQNPNTMQEGISNEIEIKDNTKNSNNLCQSVQTTTSLMDDQSSGWVLPVPCDSDIVLYQVSVEALEKQGKDEESRKRLSLTTDKAWDKDGGQDMHIDNPVHVNEDKDGCGPSSERASLAQEKLGWGFNNNGKNIHQSVETSTSITKDQIIGRDLPASHVSEDAPNHATEFVATGANVIPMGTRKFNHQNPNTVQEGIFNEIEIHDNTKKSNNLYQSVQTTISPTDDQSSGWVLSIPRDGDIVPYQVSDETLEKQGKEEQSRKRLSLTTDKDWEKDGVQDMHIDDPVHVSEDKDGWGSSSERASLAQEKLGWDFNDNGRNIHQSVETGTNITEDQIVGWDLPASCDSENAPDSGWGEVFGKQIQADSWNQKRDFEKGGTGDMHFDNPVPDSEEKDGWVSSYERTNLGQEKSCWDFNDKGTEDKTEKIWETSGQSGQSEKRPANVFIPTGANVIPMGQRKFNHRNPNTMQEGNPHNIPSFHAFAQSDISTMSEEQTESMRIKCEFEELSGLMRTILHHKSYLIGERLNPEDEKNVMEKILLYHPSKDDKIGCGVDYIKIDSHKDHPSRCFFVVRKDGTQIDFSYWKCLKGFLISKYPRHVDQFSSYFSRGKNMKEIIS